MTRNWIAAIRKLFPNICPGIKTTFCLLPCSHSIKRFCLSSNFVSDCFLGIVKYLGELAAKFIPFVIITKAAGIPDYLIFIYCTTNALLFSNIIGMTLKDIEKAVKNARWFSGRLYHKKCQQQNVLYREKTV